MQVLQSTLSVKDSFSGCSGEAQAVSANVAGAGHSLDGDQVRPAGRCPGYHVGDQHIKFDKSSVCALFSLAVGSVCFLGTPEVTVRGLQVENTQRADVSN